MSLRPGRGHTCPFDGSKLRKGRDHTKGGKKGKPVWQCPRCLAIF